MIFSLIDKKREGFIIKLDCAQYLDLDSNVLEELGFQTTENFVECLKQFPTKDQGIMTENEFISFLLSQSKFSVINEELMNQNIEINYENEINNDEEAKS